MAEPQVAPAEAKESTTQAVDPIQAPTSTSTTTEPVASSSQGQASTGIEQPSQSTQPAPPTANAITNGNAAATTSTSPITLRPPSTKPFKASSVAPSTPPSLSWLEGTWHVTHSTLPMWKKNRNVQIKYTVLPGGQIDDLVSYQSQSGTKIKTVHGVDKAEGTQAEQGKEEADKANWAYHWRGKGWLVIATTRWEILGFGEEEGTGNKWVVTHFAKTLFTPAGVDIYSRNQGGLTQETIDNIKKALEGLGHAEVANLAGKLFEVKADDARKTS